MKFKSSLIIALLFFLTGSQAQKIYSHGGKYGVTDTNGRIVTELKYDSVYITKQEKDEEGGNKFVITKKDHKYGIVLFPSDTMPIIIEPKFDTIFQYEDDYIVLNQFVMWGFITYNSTSKATDNLRMFSDYRINISKVFISEMEYDKIDHRYLYKDDKCGYLFKSTLDYLNGQSFSEYCIMPAIYDEFHYNKKGSNFTGSYETGVELEKKYYTLFKVIKDGYANYLSVNDRSAKDSFKTLFPYIYNNEEVTYLENGLFIINKQGKPLKLYSAIDSSYHQLKDEQGKDVFLDKNFRYWIKDYCVYNSITKSMDTVIIISGLNGSDNNVNRIALFVNTKNGSTIIFSSDEEDWCATFADKFYVKYELPTIISISKGNRKSGRFIGEYQFLTYPDKREIFKGTHYGGDEIELYYPNEDDYNCCCKYIEICRGSHYETLGFINMLTLEYVKRRPWGCKKSRYPLNR